MANHTQPTKEELQEKIDASLEEIDKEEEKDQEVVDKAKELDEEADKEQEEDSEESGKEVDQELKKEVEKSKDNKPEDEKDDKYKKRYQDSSREAQILYNKNKKMAEAIEKAGEVVEPTTEELQAKYSDWEAMTDFEKDMAKQNLTHSKQLNAIRDATKDFKEMDAWNGKVDKFMADPETLSKHSELEGKEEEFKLFSSLPTRRGVDFDVLISSFLYEEGKKVVKKKGSMMPTGTAGSKKSKPNDGKLSLSEAQRLRTANYKQYLKEMKAGRISLEV